MKKLIRLTEGDLRNIVKTSVKRILSEISSETGAKAAGIAARKAAHPSVFDKKSKAQYAAQAERLRKATAQKADDEVEQAHTKRKEEGTHEWNPQSRTWERRDLTDKELARAKGQDKHITKCQVNKAYQDARDGKVNTKELPKFGRRDK